MRDRKLSDAAVVRLREAAAAGESFAELARAYRVSRSTVSLIARGLRRAGVGGPRVAGRHGRLTAGAVAAIRRRAAAGERAADLAREHGIEPGYACAILRGRHWRDAGGPLSRHGWDAAAGTFRRLPVAATP